MKEYSIITGASGLLGQQHALALVEAGFNLRLIDIDYFNLKKIQKKIQKKFRSKKIISYSLDITNEQEIIKMKNFLKNKKIKISVLVNNAAMNPKMKEINKNTKTGDIENYPINLLRTYATNY